MFALFKSKHILLRDFIHYINYIRGFMSGKLSIADLFNLALACNIKLTITYKHLPLQIVSSAQTANSFQMIDTINDGFKCICINNLSSNYFVGGTLSHALSNMITEIMIKYAENSSPTILAIIRTYNLELCHAHVNKLISKSGDYNLLVRISPYHHTYGALKYSLHKRSKIFTAAGTFVFMRSDIIAKNKLFNTSYYTVLSVWLFLVMLLVVSFKLNPHSSIALGVLLYYTTSEFMLIEFSKPATDIVFQCTKVLIYHNLTTYRKLKYTTLLLKHAIMSVFYGITLLPFTMSGKITNLISRMNNSWIRDKEIFNHNLASLILLIMLEFLNFILKLRYRIIQIHHVLGELS